MDSHGRRVYGIDERTHDRGFFSELPENRPTRGGNVKTVEITTGSSRGSSGIDFLAIIKTVVIIGTILAITRNILEELSSQNQDQNDQDGDAFDKLFGSEFTGKFKDARLNEGIFHERRREKMLRDSKLESNTTPQADIRKLIPLPETVLLNFLRSAASAKPQRSSVVELSRCSQAEALFRILYRGYTYRELLSERTGQWDCLSGASAYILEAFRG